MDALGPVVGIKDELGLVVGTMDELRYIYVSIHRNFEHFADIVDALKGVRADRGGGHTSSA